MGKIMKKYLFGTLFLMLVLLGTSFAQESSLTEPNTINFTAVYKGLTYYVKNSGNDSLDGLSDITAWKTLAKVQSTSFKQGDTIYLKRDDIWTEDLSFPSSGELLNEITLGAYGSGDRPIINRLRFYLAKQYVTVKSIEMHNLSGTGIIMIEGGNNIIIDDCILDGLHNGNSDLLLILGNKNIGYASDILIKNSTVKNAGPFGAGYGGGINVVGLSRRVTVENCTITGNGEFGIQIYSGSPELIPSELKVTGCRIIGTANDYVQGAGVNIGWYAENCIVENNYIENNRIGMAIDGKVTGTNIYRNNIVYNSVELCTIGAGRPGSGANAKILNNTLIAGDHTLIGIWFSGDYGGTGNVAKNNIIVMSEDWWPGIRIESGYTVDSDHNNIYSVNGNSISMVFGGVYYDTIEAWRTATGQDINSIEGEPHLETDYTLQSFRSPCIGAGESLADVTSDYFGATRTEPYDIGAHAFE
jgi:hypothetical protein